MVGLDHKLLMKMWESISALRSLSHALMWFAGTCAVLAALATGARYYVDRRVGQLSSFAQAAAAKSAEEARQRDKDEADRKILEAKKDAAAAQSSLLQFQLDSRPRLQRLFSGEFAKALKGKEAGAAKIWYVAKDEEAQFFAWWLGNALREGGWRVGETVVIPEFADLPPEVTPFIKVAGGIPGPGGYVVRESPLCDRYAKTGPIWNLHSALATLGYIGHSLGGEENEFNRSLAKDEVLFIIGHKDSF